MGSRVATDTSSGGEMSAQEVALLEQQLEQLTQRVAQLRQQKVQLEERVERTQRDLRDSATRLQKWRIEIKVHPLFSPSILPLVSPFVPNDEAQTFLGTRRELGCKLTVYFQDYPKNPLICP